MVNIVLTNGLYQHSYLFLHLLRIFSLGMVWNVVAAFPEAALQRYFLEKVVLKIGSKFTATCIGIGVFL